MKDHDKNKESSYRNYWDVNKLHGWVTSQKLPVNNFEWIEETSQLNEDFIKKSKEKSDEGYFLEVGVQYPIKITWTSYWFTIFIRKNVTWESRKLVTNLHDKNEYVVHIRNLKQASNNGLNLKKVHRVIKFNQKAWLKPHIKMNTEVRKIAKKRWIWKSFFKLMNNTVFGKTMEYIRKHRDIKLVATERRRNYLVSEPNYHTKRFFRENFSQKI